MERNLFEELDGESKRELKIAFFWRCSYSGFRGVAAMITALQNRML